MLTLDDGKLLDIDQEVAKTTQILPEHFPRSHSTETCIAMICDSLVSCTF